MDDKFGNRYVKLDDVKDGMSLWLDHNFPCHVAGKVTAHGVGENAHFVCNRGVHSLMGQCGSDDYCIGVYAFEPDFLKGPKP